jgi:triosephosphate isomerase (TIM)
MRTPIVAGNWKMNTTLPEALALVDDLRGPLEVLEGVDVVVCPPFVSLAAVAERLAGSRVAVGAQNVHFERSGAYTGEISPPMLQGLARYVIVGHSERRQYFAETDETVQRKARAALEHGLTPIVCVGENLEQNEAGQTRAVVGGQVERALDGLDSSADFVIAYEPIWAIGTGRAATAAAANEVIAFIRERVGRSLGGPTAERTRIQYGGSVTPDNFSELMQQSDIDGALVGGASLKADLFARICEQAAGARRG